MKLHVVLFGTIFLQLLLDARSQFPQPSMPYGQPMAMPSMPMGMPMPMMPQQRMPVVVMPYHSKAADKFRRRKRIKKIYQESESSCSSDSVSGSEESSSDEANFRADTGPRKKRRQILTPVVSYMTKDGYVVYQKKVRKDRAKDWLDLGKGKSSAPDASKEQSGEMTLRQLKKKFGSAKKRRHRHGHRNG